MRYRKQRRGGKGLRDIRTSERNGPVVGIHDPHASCADRECDYRHEDRHGRERDERLDRTTRLRGRAPLVAVVEAAESRPGHHGR